ncbi:MAG: HEAT repeat domain-containing protein [Dehalobacterium sp.]
MHGNLTDHIDNYLDQLPLAGRAEAVSLLKKIEDLGRDIPGTAKRLIPLLHHPDYLVRSRIFIALGRIKDSEVSEQLLDYLDSEPGEEWQLRVLECFYLFNDQKVVSRLSHLLKKHHEPIITRGVAWLLGYLGGEEAFKILLEFAVSPKGRLVKSDIIYEGLALALQSLDHADDYWKETLSKNTSIARFFLYSRLPEVDRPRFSVYPYPDYLLDQAKGKGIKAKEFKKLYYREQA